MSFWVVCHRQFASSAWPTPEQAEADAARHDAPAHIEVWTQEHMDALLASDEWRMCELCKLPKAVDPYFNYGGLGDSGYCGNCTTWGTF